MLRSTGQVIYDPHRGKMKSRINMWCVMNVSKEITRYYRWWMKYQYHVDLQPPSFDAHISIVRGEQITPDKMELWKKYQKQVFEFEYDHGNIQKCRSGRTETHKDYNENMEQGYFFMIPVQSEIINVIRSELGLPTFSDYHLTIGRTYEYICRAENRKNQLGKK